jgi:hypothetical protein
MVSKMQHGIRGVNVGLNMDAMVFFFFGACLCFILDALTTLS